MFTGIVEKKAKVTMIYHSGKIARVTVAKPAGWKLEVGQSVNVDGVCSTVVKTAAKKFDVEYMPETISKTTVGNLRKGSFVNLERSLRFGSFIDGHLVQGHVDARAKVTMIYHSKGNHQIEISVPRSIVLYAAQRGSIAINGVSLTIARAKKNSIIVALIPHTLAHTNLGELKKGDEVNVEADLFARYCANILSRATLSHAKKTKRS